MPQQPPAPGLSLAELIQAGVSRFLAGRSVFPSNVPAQPASGGGDLAQYAKRSRPLAGQRSLFGADAPEESRKQADDAKGQRRLFDDDGGKWITIGGHAAGGAKHAGGTPVKIDEAGNIVAGPQRLQDEGVTNLSQFGEDGDGSQSADSVKSAPSPAKPAKPTSPPPEGKVQMVQAKKVVPNPGAPDSPQLGEISNVDGIWRRAGHWMPTHGGFVGQEAAPKRSKAQSEATSPEASTADSNSEKEDRKRWVKQHSPEEAEARRQEIEAHKKWRALQRGPVGRLFDLPEDPWKFKDNGTILDEFKRWAMDVGPEGISHLINQLEGRVQKIASLNTSRLTSPFSPERREMTPEELKQVAEEAIAEPREAAKDWSRMTPRLYPKQEKAVPGTHYARELLHSYMEWAGQRDAWERHPERMEQITGMGDKTHLEHIDSLLRGAEDVGKTARKTTPAPSNPAHAKLLEQPKIRTQGKTFAAKGTLKSLGARWDADAKSWTFDPSKLTDEQRQELLHSMPRLEQQGVAFYSQGSQTMKPALHPLHAIAVETAVYSAVESAVRRALSSNVTPAGGPVGNAAGEVAQYARSKPAPNQKSLFTAVNPKGVFDAQGQKRMFEATGTHWVTIGGHAEGGKKHAGGTPVEIDGEGNIVNGPQWLKDAGVTSLGQPGKGDGDIGEKLEAKKAEDKEAEGKAPEATAPEATAPAPAPADPEKSPSQTMLDLRQQQGRLLRQLDRLSKQNKEVQQAIEHLQRTGQSNYGGRSRQFWLDRGKQLVENSNATTAQLEEINSQLMPGSDLRQAAQAALKQPAPAVAAPAAEPAAAAESPDFNEMVRAARDYRYLHVKDEPTADRTPEERKAWRQHSEHGTKSAVDKWLMSRFGIDEVTARSVSNRAGEDPGFETGNNSVRWVSDEPEPTGESLGKLPWQSATTTAAPTAAPGAAPLAVNPFPTSGAQAAEQQPEQEQGKEPWQMSKRQFEKEAELNGNPLRTDAHRNADYYKSRVQDIIRSKFGQSSIQHLFESVAKQHEMPDGRTYWDVIQAGEAAGPTDHRSAVESAIASGKPVPPEVLADYPDLAEQYRGKQQQQPAPAAQAASAAPAASTPTAAAAPQSTMMPIHRDATNQINAYLAKSFEQQYLNVRGRARVAKAQLHGEAPAVQQAVLDQLRASHPEVYEAIRQSPGGSIYAGVKMPPAGEAEGSAQAPNSQASPDLPQYPVPGWWPMQSDGKTPQNLPSTTTAAEGFEPYESESFPGKWEVSFKKGQKLRGGNLFDTKEEANWHSHIQAADLKRREDADAKQQAIRQQEEQQKANRAKAFKDSGLTPQQYAAKARSSAHMQQQVRYNGEVMTRAEMADKQLNAGFVPKSYKIPDHAAQREAMQRASAMALQVRGLPPDHPRQQKYKELLDLAENAHTLGYMMDQGGYGRKLTKTEYDYAVAQMKARQESQQQTGPAPIAPPVSAPATTPPPAPAPVAPAAPAAPEAPTPAAPAAPAPGIAGTQKSLFGNPPAIPSEIWRRTKKQHEQDRSAANHRDAVQAALAAGKPVPPQVLADYPDLTQSAAREQRTGRPPAGTVGTVAPFDQQVGSGTIVKDQGGNEFMVMGFRSGFLQTVPIVNGKPVVGRDFSKTFRIGSDEEDDTADKVYKTGRNYYQEEEQRGQQQQRQARYSLALVHPAHSAYAQTIQSAVVAAVARYSASHQRAPQVAQYARVKPLAGQKSLFGGGGGGGASNEEFERLHPRGEHGMFRLKDEAGGGGGGGGAASAAPAPADAPVDAPAPALEEQEPWQMTAAEYSGRGKPNYGDFVQAKGMVGILRGGNTPGRPKLVDTQGNFVAYINHGEAKLIRRQNETGGKTNQLDEDWKRQQSKDLDAVRDEYSDVLLKPSKLLNEKEQSRRSEAQRKMEEIRNRELKYDETTRSPHYMAVKGAIAAGKSVPPHVLAEYPDLAPRPAPSPADVGSRSPAPAPAALSPAPSMQSAPGAAPLAMNPFPGMGSNSPELKTGVPYSATLHHGSQSTLTGGHLLPGGNGGPTTDAGNMGTGVYLTPHERIASFYANGNQDRIHKISVDFKNPIVLHGDKNAEAQAFAKRIGVTASPQYDGYKQVNGDWSKEFAQKAKDAGHDGIIWAKNGKVEEVASFHPVAISGNSPTEAAPAPASTPAPTPAPTPKPKPPAPAGVEGVQKSLFGGQDMKTGQKSLFNVALPSGGKTKKPAPRREPTLKELGVVPIPDPPKQGPSLPGQTYLYSLVNDVVADCVARYARGIVKDPEFEALHPRDYDGEFIEKDAEPGMPGDASQQPQQGQQQPQQGQRPQSAKPAFPKFNRRRDPDEERANRQFRLDVAKKGGAEGVMWKGMRLKFSPERIADDEQEEGKAVWNDIDRAGYPRTQDGQIDWAKAAQEVTSNPELSRDQKVAELNKLAVQKDHYEAWRPIAEDAAEFQPGPVDPNEPRRGPEEPQQSAPATPTRDQQVAEKVRQARAKEHLRDNRPIPKDATPFEIQEEEAPDTDRGEEGNRDTGAEDLPEFGPEDSPSSVPEAEPAPEPQRPQQPEQPAPAPQQAPQQPQQAQQPTGRGTIGPGTASVSDLQVDPQRFQYKLHTDNPAGVTQQFADAKFNPELAGTIHVWEDPEDGKTYVVNGHHRFELAQRSGYDGPLEVYRLKAGSAQEARAKGALVNIAGGNGTAIDAAKFMRDTGTTPEEMNSTHGVSLKGPVARDAAVLSKLSPGIFRRLTTGIYDEGRALAIAKHLPNHEDQDRIDKFVENAENNGRELSNSTVEEMAREAAMAGRQKRTTKSLFGDLEDDRNLFVERATLKGALRRDLAARLNKFKAVATTRAAKTLEGKNQIDAGANRAEADRLAQFLESFDMETTRRGPVSDRLNQAAQELASAPRKQKQILDSLARDLDVLIASGGGVGGAVVPGNDARAAEGVSGGRGGDSEELEAKPYVPIPGQKQLLSLRTRDSLDGMVAAAVARYSRINFPRT